MAIDDILNDLKQDGGSPATAAHKQISDALQLNQDRAMNLVKIQRILDTLECNLERTTVPHSERISAWLGNYRHELAGWSISARQRFGSELADGLRPLGITLQGQAPSLRAGLFSIELRAEQNKVEIWYGPKQERLADAPMSAELVCKKIEQIRKGMGSDLEPPALIVKIQEALRRVPPIEGQRGLPIGLVLPEVAFLIQSPTFSLNPVREYYRSYSRADFSYDLFRCAEDASLRKRIQLVVATRKYTARKPEYLWVPSDLTGRGSTYSHIIAEETRP